MLTGGTVTAAYTALGYAYSKLSGRPTWSATDSMPPGQELLDELAAEPAVGAGDENGLAGQRRHACVPQLMVDPGTCLAGMGRSAARA